MKKLSNEKIELLLQWFYNQLWSYIIIEDVIKKYKRGEIKIQDENI